MLRRPLLAPLALALPLLAPPALAGDLAPVHVDGSRSDVLAAPPAGTLVIDREQLDRTPATSLVDVLAQVAGVRASRLYSGLDGQSSVDLLGFGQVAGQNTLVLLNGRRLNPVDLGTPDLSGIPLSVVERIEILPGLGGVRYGHGASGGVINIVTRDGREAGTGLAAWGGSDRLRGGQAWAGAGTDDSSVLASVQGEDSDGFRDNGGHRQRSGWLDLRHQAGDTTLYLIGQVDDQEQELAGSRLVDRSTGLNQWKRDPEGAQTPFDDGRRQGYQLLPGVIAQGRHVTLYLEGSLQQRELDTRYHTGGLTRIEGESRTLALQPRLAGQLGGAGLRHDWTLGADLIRTDYRQHVNGTRSRDLERRQTAWYGQWHTAWTPHWSTAFGARTETVVDDWQLGGARHRHDLEFYEGVLTWQPVPVLALFASAARSVRLPSVDEFQASGDALAPQTGQVYTTGLRWQEGPQQSVMTLFRGDFEREILYDPGLNGPAGNINLDDDTRREGVTLNSRWTLSPSLFLTLNATWQRARFRDGPWRGNDLPAVPHRSRFLQLDWQAHEAVTLSVAWRHEGRRVLFDDLANQQHTLPPQNWTDLMATARWRAATLRVGLYNLQDRNNTDLGLVTGPDQYAVYPLPGRHVRAHLSWSF